MASSSATELHLPSSFPYPVKVVSIDAATDALVQRGSRLLTYSFVHVPARPDAPPESRFGTWDSAVDGTVHAWKVRPGEVISQRKAKDRPVVLILEECKHGMQISGLCVLCGKDMTNSDYIGFADSSRAHIQMTHSANGPLVSLEEAQRLEKETADDLLKARKLSLIVDLDQTIVHATVDPTIGDWRAEGAAWKARHALRKPDAPDANPDSSDSDDECNPNWEAVEDVGEFKLGAEAFGIPPGKGKGKMLENEGPMYYIKRRPGWEAFLEDMATKYQMHVYTMGTRAYAEQVCALIDPTGKIFGGRLLSRDESGSLTQKSLQRLFPCDTSMVVIIDDRADVWEWSPNLIKVVPYDFFVGIGDINSVFLPKLEPLTPATPPTAVASKETPPVAVSTPDPPPSADPAQVTPSLPAPVPPAEAAQAELTEKAMLTQNTIALEAQVEERPLAKKQEQLEVALDEAPTPTQSPAVVSNEAPTPAPKKHHRKAALLKNDDNELQRLGRLLDEVHQRFFTAYEARRVEKEKADGSKKRRNSIKPKPAYDVTLIIPRIRAEVFDGVHILFSSVIPLDTNPEATEIWKMARMFGAKCSTELTADVTHVVAAKRGTVKVDAARKRGGIKIVWLAWFTDSIALWQRQDETAYLLDDAPIVVSSADPLPASASADDEADDEEWRSPAQGEGGANSDLALDAIDWNDINDEVDAAMNESDDDEEEDARSERSVMSEEDWTDDASSVQTNSGPSTPTRQKRKRMRSLTPGSAEGVNGTRDALGSPLAKRKKVAAERTGYSKLKEEITASEPPSVDATQKSTKPPSVDGAGESEQTSSPASRNSDDGTQQGDDGEDDDGEDDEDDFLAREMEEEWG
ncbi:hypothetical protein DFH06DRAFT_1073723 [Mycena polygramma]|nr:hypothetical protein DFH06DRAFT_1073723 [Mycena polygramma]